MFRAVRTGDSARVGGETVGWSWQVGGDVRVERQRAFEGCLPHFIANQDRRSARCQNYGTLMLISKEICQPERESENKNESESERRHHEKSEERNKTARRRDIYSREMGFSYAALLFAFSTTASDVVIKRSSPRLDRLTPDENVFLESRSSRSQSPLPTILRGTCRVLAEPRSKRARTCRRTRPPRSAGRWSVAMANWSRTKERD